jgi:hypothetical protein
MKLVNASVPNGLRSSAGRYRPLWNAKSAREAKRKAMEPPSLGGLRSRVQGRHPVPEYLCFRGRPINCTIRADRDGDPGSQRHPDHRRRGGEVPSCAAEVRDHPLMGWRASYGHRSGWRCSTTRRLGRSFRGSFREVNANTVQPIPVTR